MKTILTKTVRKTMKRNYKHTGIMTCAVFTLLAIVGLSGLAVADDGSDYRPGECVVTSSNVSGSGTLKRNLDKYNNVNGADPRYRGCTRLISFAGVPNGAVNVTNTLNIAYAQATSSNTLTIDGAVNGDAGTPVRLDVDISDTTKPVFLVKDNNRGKVVIKNMVVSGTGNTFLKCEQGASVELSNIEIANTPSSALMFEGCNTVKLTNVTVTNGTTGGADVAVIDISGATTATVSNVRAESSSGDSENAPSVKGVFLQIVGPTQASVQIVVNNLASGTAAYLSGLDDQGGSRMQLASLDVTGSNVQNGVVLNYVDGSTTSVKLNLLGRPTSAGNGLVLDQGVTQFKFGQLTSIKQFGADGIQIWDSSNFNSFDGVTVENNGGNGVVITEQARGTSLTNSKVVNNAVCGVVINSTQGTVIKKTQLQNNGATGCPIKVDSASPVTVLAESDVILIPTSDNSMQLDVVPTLVGGGGSSAEILELHRLTRGAEVSSVPVPSKGKTGKKGATKKTKTGARTAASAVVSGDLPGSDSGSSYIKEFNLASLPAPVDRNAADHYFALITNQGGEVVAYWQGKALGSGSLSGLSCYEDPTSSTGWTRVYQQDLDSDSDGIFDHEEDANRNCQTDTGETSVDSADTDGDGLGDFIESKSTSNTSALDNDSDDDGLPDGLEDLNKSGSFEQEYCVTDSSSAQFGWCETDAAKADTDGDTLGDARERALGTDPNSKNTDRDSKPDNLDECPLLHPDDGECYYANCAAGVALPSDQDTDEDGVRDDDEDTNNNCQRDANETDVQSADTDGDGIPDGVEDFNRNGVYEAELGESNPLNTDTDGDGIGDGAEDKNHDGKIESGAGETSPIMTDSDGDTLLDNVEDKNKNGAQDPGETSAAVADTDGDGMNDNVDPAPWSIKPNTVVYYCDVAGFDQDTDGDGLNDKDEDYNGDCLHTAIEKEPHPLKKDTDTDGLDDGLEACYETNPNVADTDGDGRSDFDEVKASGLTCTNMYNLGGTNPLRAEYGSCSLNTDDATSGSVLPIILMMALAVIPMVVIRRKKM